MTLSSMALLPAQPEDLELAIAQAGCALMDAEQGGKRVADRIETLKRWCAARIRHPAFGGWVVFRFRRAPRLRASRRGAPAGSAASGSATRSGPPAAGARRLQAHGRADGTARSAERDPLLRAVPRARQGLVLEGLADKDGTLAVNPLGVELAGCPLDEKISEMHALEGRRRHRRAGARRPRQPDVPGHRTPHLQ